MRSGARLPRALAPLLMTVLSLGLSATAASAAPTTLSWTHANPTNVTGFTVHLGQSSLNYTPELTLTFPGLQADADGVFRVTIEIEPDRLIYVAVRAFNDTGSSSYSNERTRYSATPLGVPGRPRLSSN